MNEAMRMTWLRVFLRILSIVTLTAFIPWIVLILLNAPILAPGGRLAPLLRFQPYNASYESMMSALYIVWAVTLWRASDNPAKHPLFIDFNVWATTAHALVMLIATPVQKGLVMSAIEGLPLLVAASVLWWLRPMPRKHQPAEMFCTTVRPLEEVEEGTDRWALRHGLVSMTPLRLDLTDRSALDARGRLPLEEDSAIVPDIAGE